MVLSITTFVRCFPTAKDEELWCEKLNKFLPRYGIDSKARLTHFLTQCGYESSGFTKFEENLYYTTKKSLIKTFSRYINKDNAHKYVKNPKKLANYVYSDAVRKSPLGNTSPNDGWTYRGRGIIQLTGKFNYNKFAKDSRLHEKGIPNYLSSKQGAVHSACWYWNTNGLNELADKNDFLKITKKVVGSTKNQYNREKLFDSISKIIYGEYKAIEYGDRGLLVKKIQEKLGIKADGIFGDQTKNAFFNFITLKVPNYRHYPFHDVNRIKLESLKLLFNEKNTSGRNN